MRRVLTRYDRCEPRYRLYSAIRSRTCPFEALEPHGPDAGLIVDLGCGHGLFANLLSVTAPARRIVGIDLSEKKIAVARKSAAADPRIEFRVGDMTSCALPPDASCFCLIDVLSYLDDRQKTRLLERLFAALPPGGSLLIKTMHNSPRWKALLANLHMGIFDRFVMHSGLTMERRDWPIDRLRQTLTDLGFTVAWIDLARGYFYPRCLLVCQKIAA
jgi:trans-aconitate methyltransferase